MRKDIGVKVIVIFILMFYFNSAHALSVVGNIKRLFVNDEYISFWIRDDQCKSQDVAGVQNTYWQIPLTSPVADKWFDLLTLSYSRNLRVLIRVDACLPDQDQTIDYIVLDQSLGI